MKQEVNVNWSLETLFLHGDKQNHLDNESSIPTIQPIYTSTTYLYQDTNLLENACDYTKASEQPKYIYSQYGNPNTHALEQILTRIEGGAGAVVFGSGMAAIHTALMAAGLAPTRKILVSRDIYGSTIEQLQNIFVPLGVEVIIEDLSVPDVAGLIFESLPDVIFVETLSNPLIKVVDMDAISAAAHKVGAIAIVDSTFTTPYLIRPIEHGFDLVVYSATKYIGGHGDCTAGVVISSSQNLLARVRKFAAWLSTALSPFDAYLIMRGLRTLPLRIERQSTNAKAVASFLEQHQAIAKVYYPGLPDHPQFELASRLFRPPLFGGILSFELKLQTREAVFCFMDRLQLFLKATTLGDIYSEVSYPLMSSHRGLSKSERQQIGLREGCVRLSVGIEEISDIINDLKWALEIFE